MSRAELHLVGVRFCCHLVTSAHSTLELKEQESWIMLVREVDPISVLGSQVRCMVALAPPCET